MIGFRGEFKPLALKGCFQNIGIAIIFLASAGRIRKVEGAQGRIYELNLVRTHQFLFLSVLPAAAAGGGAVSCFANAGFLLAVAGFAALFGRGAFLVPGFVTIVVPALESLAPLVLPSASAVATVRLPVWRLGARVEAFVGGAADCADDSVDGFSGDCGYVRELCDFGDNTPAGAGPALREAVRVAFELATTAPSLVRFLGLARSSVAGAGRFSLSSPVEMSSLRSCQLGSPTHGLCIIPFPLRRLFTGSRRLGRCLCYLHFGCNRHWWWREWVRLGSVLIDQVLDVPLAQSLWDAVDAHFESCSQALCLQCVLRS